MQFTTSSEQARKIKTDCLILGIAQDQPFDAIARDLDSASVGALTRLDASKDLPRQAGKTLMLHALPGIEASRLLIVGLGKTENYDGIAYVKAVQAAGKALRQSAATSAHCLLASAEVLDRDRNWKARQAALALAHSDYIYTATKKPKDGAPPATDSISFPAEGETDKQLKIAAALVAGIQRCRDLGDAPPNICTPVYLAETAEKLAAKHKGLKVEVLDENQMAKLGMGALLAVGQGSANPPRLIRMSWKGGKEGEAPLALIGKGVTFDTGGISLKPRELMEQMKFDMCGAAATMGVMEAIVLLKLPINVEGVVAAVENMPDGRAYRPGDVITSMSGKTIEVHNTDAEGRLILADALTWTGQNLKPAAIVDIATLTGACVMALGHHASGVMSRDDDLAGELLSAGTEAADRAWRLPLWDEYQEQIETPFADMKNLGGLPAGAITAACLLSRFTEGQRWAHVDIAGSAWQWGKPESASGRPVGMLVQWLVDRAGGWDSVG